VGCIAEFNEQIELVPRDFSQRIVFIAGWHETDVPRAKERMLFLDDDVAVLKYTDRVGIAVSAQRERQSEYEYYGQ